MVWQSIGVKDVFQIVDKWLTVPDLCELLGVSPGKVHLIVDGEPLPSLPGTLSVLEDAGFTVGQAIEWLYTEDETLGHAPIVSLLNGRKSEVRRLAQSLAF
jgi:hypothetical protein